MWASKVGASSLDPLLVNVVQAASSGLYTQKIPSKHITYFLMTPTFLVNMQIIQRS